MTHLKVFQDAPSRFSRPASLNEIEISSPCDVPWDSLRGDDRIRACGKCHENVYNISALTRVEALRLIRSHEGRICVRIHRRPDGTVVTGDCWSRLRAARKRGLLVFVGVLFVVGCIQLAAMFVGLRGLRNLVSGHRTGGVTMGARVPPMLRPDEPEPQFQFEPAPRELMGKMAPQAPEPTPKTKAKGKTRGKRPSKDVDRGRGTMTMGKMLITDDQKRGR